MYLKGKSLKSQTQLMLMNVLCYFEGERDHKGPNVPLTSVIKRTAEACGVTEKTVTRTKARLAKCQEAGKSVPNSPQKTRKRQKKQSTDVDNYVKDVVKRTIYDMHSKSLPVTVKSLVKKLKDDNIFSFSVTGLTKLLHLIGFDFKKDDLRRGLFEQDHIVASRTTFLRNYFKNKDEAMYNPVFLDETWIFSRGSSKSTWHDDDVRSLRKKSLGEGKRFIVLCAGNSNGFIQNSSLVFSTKQQSMDYHDNMNAEMFRKWFEQQLLQNLEKPSLIILDNASYHSTLIEKIPTYSWKKDQIIEFLNKHKINYTSDMLKVELLALAKQKNISKKYLIDQLAEEWRHKTLRLPPYHCQFNAIKLIWANCKEFYNKNVGQSGFTDKSVIALWEDSLKRIDANYWQKCIAHAEKQMQEWWDVQKQVDIVQEPIIININQSSTDDSDAEDTS